MMRWTFTPSRAYRARIGDAALSSSGCANTATSVFDGACAPAAATHLGVPLALAHHVEHPAVILICVRPAGQPFGDRRVDDAAARVHLVDRADELVALRDPILQEVREAAVTATQQREGVLLVVVGR